MLGRGHVANLGDVLAKTNNTLVLFVHNWIHCESFFIWENDYPISMVLKWHRSQHFWTIAVLRRGFFNRLKLFPPSLLTALDTVATEIFFLFAIFVILRARSSLKAFLIASLLITWGLPERGRSLRVLLFLKRSATRCTVIQLTFSCLAISDFLWPAHRRADTSTLFASILLSFLFRHYLLMKIQSETN